MEGHAQAHVGARRLPRRLGISFSDKRKSSKAEKLQDLAFTKLNVE